MVAVRRAGALLGLALACSSAPEDPAERLLAGVEEAAEERDAEAFGRHLAPDFTGGALNRAAATAEVGRWLKLYDGVEVTISELERTAEGGGARLRFRADFSGRPKDLPGLQGMLPGASAYRFDLKAGPGADGAWTISRASWEQVPFPAETAP
jgi:hypothetical protein